MNNLPLTFSQVNVSAVLREFVLLDKTILYSSLRMPFDGGRSLTLNNTKIYVHPRFSDFRGHHTHISFSLAKLLKGGGNKVGFSRIADYRKATGKWLPLLNNELVKLSGCSKFDLFDLPAIKTEAAFNVRVDKGDDWTLLNYLGEKNLPHFRPSKKCEHKRSRYWNNLRAYEPVYQNGNPVLKPNGEPQKHPPRRVATVYLPADNREWNKNEYQPEFVVRFEERFSRSYLTSRLSNRNLSNDFYTLHQVPVMQDLFLSGGLINLFDKKDRQRIRESLHEFGASAA